MALSLLSVTLVPQPTSAAEAIFSNETQTDFEIKQNVTLASLLAYDAHNPFQLARYNATVKEPVKTQEEIEREARLARFKDKLAVATLPAGKFQINASAYTAAADECGKSDGITASGVKVKESRTLACPPAFPFGAKIKIEGHGTYVCEDRGGAIKGNHFDIYMQTKKEAFTFGRRILLAEVVK